MFESSKDVTRVGTQHRSDNPCFDSQLRANRPQKHEPRKDQRNAMKIDFAEETSHLPRELVDFGRRQIVNATMYKGNERRFEGRHHLLLPVRAIPVDANNAPVGESFDLITRDIAASAISLLHTDPIDAHRLALQLRIAGETVNVVIDIVWSEPMGPFYGAGGEFRDKLDFFPG